MPLSKCVDTRKLEIKILKRLNDKISNAKETLDFWNKQKSLIFSNLNELELLNDSHTNTLRFNKNVDIVTLLVNLSEKFKIKFNVVTITSTYYILGIQSQTIRINLLMIKKYFIIRYLPLEDTFIVQIDKNV